MPNEYCIVRWLMIGINDYYFDFNPLLAAGRISKHFSKHSSRLDPETKWDNLLMFDGFKLFNFINHIMQTGKNYK